MTCDPSFMNERYARGPDQRPRLGFIMEQTLGQLTYYQNLRALVDADPGVSAAWYPLAPDHQGWVEKLPLLRNHWPARVSWRTWRTLARDDAVNRYDALFFHTQVSTLLSAPLMRRIPSVLSLDATPINLDSLGAAYGHDGRRYRAIEEAKRAVNVRAMHAARAHITFSDWTRRSLIHDYGVDPARISVIPPGVDLELWPPAARRQAAGPVHILFVGGEFERKGGQILLQAFAGLGESCELHLVTKAPIEPAPRLHVYPNAMPNSEPLRNLYAKADLFVLPTLGDCFPFVIQEAMAAGLPVVASDVGGIGEAVANGETGLLVPPGNVTALRDALDALAHDRSRREAFGMRARQVAERRFDSATNGKRVLDLLTMLAAERNGRGSGLSGRRQRDLQDINLS